MVLMAVVEKVSTWENAMNPEYILCKEQLA